MARLVLVALTLALVGESAETVKPMTVCEALEQGSKIDGQMVAVRGVWATAMEANDLSVDKCTLPDAKKALWPPAIHIASLVMSDRPTTIRVDRLSFRRFRSEVAAKTAGRDGRVSSFRVIATIRGQIQFKKELLVSKHPDGVERITGYGHLGAYAAQIVAESVSDPEVEWVSGQQQGSSKLQD